MVRFNIFLLLTLAMGFEMHKMDSVQSNSVTGCAAYLSHLRWVYDGPAFFSAICEYEPAFGSWSTCIYEMLNDVEPEKGEAIYKKTIENFKGICQFANPEVAERLTFEQCDFARTNASKYLQPQDDTHTGDAIAFPIEVSKTVRMKIANAYHYYGWSYDYGEKYGCLTNAYFILIVMVACCFKFLKASAVSRYILKHKLINLARGYLILPTIAGKHAAYLEMNWLVTGLLPTTFEGLIIMGYVLLSVIGLVFSYKFDPYNVIFPSKTTQFCRMLGDRSGIMSMMQLPLIIVFSTRNNIVEFLTGFKYTTMIMFHKWIGRTMILEVCVHSIAYALYAAFLQAFKVSSSETYWKFGVVATMMCVLLLVFSIGILRKCTYETFLYVHILLVIVFFYAYFKHVEDLGYASTICLPLALWAIERILRIVRIQKFGILTANVKLVDEDIIRMTIKLPEKFEGRTVFEPGQYAFVYFLLPSIFWQSHPFTVIEVNNELTLVVKPKKGATLTILKNLKQNGGHMTIKTLVEGPYCTKSPITKFNRLLFLAGGTGIPGPLSHAIQLGSKNTKRIIDLVVTVRELDILKAYEQELLQLQKLPVHLTIHLTKQSSLQYGSTQDTEIINKLKSFASIMTGRPNLQKLISDSIYDTSLAVVCCGPAPFVDNARDITARTIVENPHTIVEYFEEYQCW